MTYIKLNIHIAEPFQEQMIAELVDLGFDGFQQLEDSIITFQPKKQYSPQIQETIETLLKEMPAESFIELQEEVEQQNWNDQWEQTLEAQEIGSFFIKPTWVNQQAPEGKILIEIDPKMA